MAHSHNHNPGEKCEDHVCNHYSGVATQSLQELEFQRGCIC